MEEKKKVGGKRPGAGRKKSTDPKVKVVLYIPQSEIDLRGGLEFYKEALLKPHSPHGVFLPEDFAIVKEAPVREGSKKKVKTARKNFPKSDDEIKAESHKKAAKLEEKQLPDGSPRNLDELKKMCPKELSGFDRSEWVSTQRQKYGI